MKAILLFFLLLGALVSTAQRIVLDRGHLKSVTENNLARISAELSHGRALQDIDDRLGEIHLNLGSVILTERLIYRSLTQVDQGLKNAMALRQIGELSLEIITQSREVLTMASSAPHLLLFAERTCAQMAARGTRLVGEVSALVLKEGPDLLLDFSKRDALLKKISLELKTIRALLFSIKKCMYWAKINGIWRSANPFSGFINTDKRTVENLLLSYKILKKK